MNNIKKARETAGFSQKQVALTLHVSAPTVSDWESGKINPSVANLKELAKLFKVSTDYLLGLTDDPTASGGPLAAYIRLQRGSKSETTFAARCGISVDLLQKIERGLCQSKPSTVSVKYTCLADDQMKSIAKGIGLNDWRYIECLYFGVNPHDVEYPQPIPEPLRTSDDLPESVMIPINDRTKDFLTWLPTDSSGIYLTEKEQQLLRTYRKADDHARDMVNLALKPFTEEAAPPRPRAGL